MGGVWPLIQPNGAYLLDTCAWLDAFNAPQMLSSEVRALIYKQPSFNVASISLLEVARKVEVGNLLLAAPLEHWFLLALPQGKSQVFQITPAIAIESSRLPGDFHKDPADRLIVATARVHQLIILTSDKRILDYPHVKSVASR